MYQLPKDYLLEWVRLLALAMAVSAILLNAWTLVACRRKLSGFRPRVLLFVGVCCLPLPAMLMSAAIGLEQAKAVTFCESCHTMRSFVAEMKDDRSQSLAAIHFRNRYIQDEHCYSCHTDYGLFGTLQAKVGGVSHIWSDFVGRSGVAVRPKTDYRFTICLNCHGQSARFVAHKEHAGIVDKVIDGRATCTGCHGSSHAGMSVRRPS